MRKLALMVFAASLVNSCAVAQETETASTHAKPTPQDHAEIRPFNMQIDAMKTIDAALARAKNRNTKLLVVMGANWCHDSRGLATRFETADFKTLIENKYELVYVSAGVDPGQKDQNRAVSKRFGIDEIEGTPTVFITDVDGTVLNGDSAGYWRRADSIPADMTLAYFQSYANK